jgi:ApbE superfamily uncharacterized protein (UPF0280 family)
MMASRICKREYLQICVNSIVARLPPFYFSPSYAILRRRSSLIKYISDNPYIVCKYLQANNRISKGLSEILLRERTLVLLTRLMQH